MHMREPREQQHTLAVYIYCCVSEFVRVYLFRQLSANRAFSLEEETNKQTGAYADGTRAIDRHRHRCLCR